MEGLIVLLLVQTEQREVIDLGNPTFYANIQTAIPCTKLAAPEYGTVNVKGYSHSSRAVYACNHGYKLYGDDYITCDYGIWKGKIPVCKREYEMIRFERYI